MKKIFIILMFGCLSGNIFSQTNYNITQGLALNLLTPASPTAITGLTAENFVGPFNIGFYFPFFGTNYSTFYIGSNGVLSFGSGFKGDAGSYLNQIKIPQSNAYYSTPYIAFANADLNPSLGTPTINYALTGTAPNRVLVINFTNVQYQLPANTDLNSVQIQIFEGATGKIEIHNTINKSPQNGTYKTIGIQKGSNYEGYSAVGMNGSTTINLVNTALRFETCSTPYPVITPASPVFCTGGTTVLSATCPTGTLSWSTGATIPSISVMPTVATDYSAICTNGCTATKTVTVAQGYPPTSAPSISKTPSTNIVPGASVVLNVPSYYCAGTVTWGNGLGTGASITVNPQITTTYTATCTLNGGCVSPAGSVTVNVDRIKVVTPTPSVSCSGRTVPITFNAPGTFTNPNFTVKFHKTKALGYTCTGDGSQGEYDLVSTTTTSSPSSITLPAGLEPSGSTYCGLYYGSPVFTYVSYYFEVSNGTDISPTYPLWIYNVCSQLFNVSVSSASPICVGGNSNATVSFVPDGINAGNVYTVELSDVGGTTFPSTPVVVGTLASNTATSIPIVIPSGTAIGNYSVRVKTTNPVSSSNSSTANGYLFSVDNVPTIVPTLTKNPTTDVAPSTSVTIAATCAYGVGTWSDDIYANSSRTVTPTATTTYTATCKSPCGSSSTSTITVNVVAPPTVTTDKSIVCPGGTGATLTAAGCNSPDVVNWFINGVTASFATGLTTLVNPTASTTYVARCTRGGATSGNAFISITVGTPPAPPTGITKTPNTTVGPYTTVTLAVAANGNPIKWENGSTVNQRVVNPSVTTTYSAKTVSGGCESTTSASTTVTVDASLPQGIVISSSPNVDYYSNGKIIFCASENINLSSQGCASPDITTWYRKWYNSTATQIGTGLTLTTNNNTTLDVDGRLFYYFATCTRGGVVSPNSNEVTVGVKENSIPNNIIATPTGSVNPGTSVSLSTNGSCFSPTTIKWDDNSTLATRVVAPTTTTTYSFKCVNGTCESTASSITVVVNGPPVITATINPLCGTGSSTNTSTVLTATGCSGTVTWSSVPTNAPKPSGNSGTITNISITGNVTYTAYCGASGLTSTGLVLTYIPNENGVVTANPTQITTVGQSVTLSTSNTVGTYTWFARPDFNNSPSQIGTATSSITYTPTSTSDYSVSTIVSGCSFSSPYVKVPFQLTVTGTGNVNLDKSFNEGCGTYLFANGGSGIPTLLCPNQTVDVGTSYFNQGLTTFTCVPGGTCARAYFIKRRNNVWEIWDVQYIYPDISQRLYHTKFKFDSNRPPCSAKWIKDADGSEVTLSNTGVCENVDNTVTNITLPASICVGQSMPVSFTTSSSAASYTVELLWDFSYQYLCGGGGGEGTALINTVTTTTNTASIPVQSSFTFNPSGCITGSGCGSQNRCDNYRIRITPAGSTQGVSQSLLQLNALPTASSLLKSTQSGNWNAATTWQCGVSPTATNLVEVQSGHIVDINNDVHAKSVKLLGTGKLNYVGASGNLILNQ